MEKEYVYYAELDSTSIWGEDKILLVSDINLLENTNINNIGYGMFEIDDYNTHLQHFIKTKFNDLGIVVPDLEQYHNHVSEDQHKNILNSMPYKKNENSLEFLKFCEYLEKFVSEQINEPVKIFNDDVWVRICRPNIISSNDFNPCHRDIYLDFYRNTINIYLPIVGSNENSSLAFQPGSHLWNENLTSVTRGGAYFESTKKKYSVDAIVKSKIQLNMVRPNPSTSEVIIFSPYIIHGCSDNKNKNVTRMSLEVRFIKLSNNSINQEESLDNYIKKRVWR